MQWGFLIVPKYPCVILTGPSDEGSLVGCWVRVYLDYRSTAVDSSWVLLMSS